MIFLLFLLCLGNALEFIKISPTLEPFQLKFELRLTYPYPPKGEMWIVFPKVDGESMVKDVESTNVLVTVFDPENDDDEWDVLELPSKVVEIYNNEMTDILIFNLTSNAPGNDTFMIADVYIWPI